MNGNRTFTALDVINKASALLGARGKDYDSEQGERSGARVAEAFNAIKGAKLLKGSDIFLIQDLLKKVRQENAVGYHVDSGDDAVGYAALTAEALYQEALQDIKEELTKGN